MSEIFGLVFGAFIISVMHASLPTHWLPFVLVGRARGWTIKRVMTVAAIAGIGHVLATIALGFVVFLVGFKIAEHAGHHVHVIAGGILIVFGMVFLANHISHLRCTHDHSTVKKEFMTDKAAVISLLGILTFSPCEAILPVFLAAGTIGFKIVIPLLGVILISTVGAMLALVYVAASGIEKIKSKVLEKHENLIIGIILVILGLLVIFVFE